MAGAQRGKIGAGVSPTPRRDLVGGVAALLVLGSPATANLTDVAYAATLTITGGRAPYSIASDNLPAWMTDSLTGSTITLGGTPTTDQTNSGIFVQVQDADGRVATSAFWSVAVTTPAGPVRWDVAHTNTTIGFKIDPGDPFTVHPLFDTTAGHTYFGPNAGTGSSTSAQVNAIQLDHAAGGEKKAWEIRTLHQPDFFRMRIGMMRADFDAASSGGPIGNGEADGWVFFPYVANIRVAGTDSWNSGDNDQDGNPDWWQFEFDTTVDPPNLWITKGSVGARRGPFSLAGITGSGSFRPTYCATMEDDFGATFNDGSSVWHVKPPAAGFTSLVASGGGGGATTANSLSGITDAIGNGFATINVAAGTYGELILSSVNKTVTIQAADDANRPIFAGCTVDASNGPTLRHLKFNGQSATTFGQVVVHNTSSNITFDGCEVFCPTYVAAPPAAGSNTGMGWGFYCRDSSAITFTSGHIHHVDAGMLTINNTNISFLATEINEVYNDDNVKFGTTDDLTIQFMNIHDSHRYVDPTDHQDGIQGVTAGQTRAYGPITISDNIIYRGGGDGGAGTIQGIFIGTDGVSSDISYLNVTVQRNKVWGGSNNGITWSNTDAALITDNICQGFSDQNSGFSGDHCTNSKFKNNRGTQFGGLSAASNSFDTVFSGPLTTIDGVQIPNTNTLLAYIAPTTAAPP